jgi:collagenase-like PrtC family protease
MKYFTVPADFKKETIDRYDQLNREYSDSKVIETYGNLTLGKNFGSGRVYEYAPKTDLLDLREYIEYANERGIEFNYTFNVPYLQNMEFTKEGVAEIKAFLKELYAAGVRSITISMPSLIELVRLSGYDFKIKASTICHIMNTHVALAYKNMGIDRMVLDEGLHRDFAMLERIRKRVGEKVELIINTTCQMACPYRHFHYNSTGGYSNGVSNEVGVNFFEHKCMMQRYKDPSGFIKRSWVRPEDLHYYTDIGINYFKLQGRQHLQDGDHLRALEYYFKGSYEGNLIELLEMFNPQQVFEIYIDNKKLDGFMEPFASKEINCRHDCSECDHCVVYAKKAMDFEKTSQMIKDAKKFFTGFDLFSEMVDSVELEEEDVVADETATEFNLD